MNTLDLLVVAALAAMAGWPFAVSLFSRWATRRKEKAAPASTAGSVESWRQGWAATLISLIDDIEGGSHHFDDEKAALRLAKELLWELIGGDGPTPAKGK